MYQTAQLNDVKNQDILGTCKLIIQTAKNKKNTLHKAEKIVFRTKRNNSMYTDKNSILSRKNYERNNWAGNGLIMY